MSGNHTLYTGGQNPPSELDKECRRLFYVNWSDGAHWMRRVPDEQQTAVAILCWEIYQRAFYDGFTARLSGVKDE
jgi:hypothetical protein